MSNPTPITKHEGRKYLVRIYGPPGTEHGTLEVKRKMPDGTETDASVHWIEVDVYCVLEAFPIHCHEVGHALKKLLFAGERGKGDYRADLVGAVAAINRAIEEYDRRVAVREEKRKTLREITEKINLGLKDSDLVIARKSDLKNSGVEVTPLPQVHPDFAYTAQSVKESQSGPPMPAGQAPDMDPGGKDPGRQQGPDEILPVGGRVPEGAPAGGPAGGDMDRGGQGGYVHPGSAGQPGQGGVEAIPAGSFLAGGLRQPSGEQLSAAGENHGGTHGRDPRSECGGLDRTGTGERLPETTADAQAGVVGREFDGTYPDPSRKADFPDRRRLGGSPGNPKEAEKE